MSLPSEGNGVPAPQAAAGAVDGPGSPVRGWVARPLLRFSAERGAVPLGGIFGALGVLGALAVSLLHLDRLPYVLCVFKALTGLPCPTCGSTRAFGRLASLDLPGALWMNPLTTLGALVLVLWAVADLLLLPSRRALRVELHPMLANPLRALLLVAFLANWLFLLASSR